MSPQNAALMQKNSVILPRRDASNDPINGNDQSYSTYTPSPSSYEFALHGLLALGSTSNIGQGANPPQSSAIEPEQGVSMFDFATDSNVNPTLSRGPTQERPDLDRTETVQSSLLGYDVTSHGTSGPSPSLPSFEAFTDVNKARGATSNTSASANKTPFRHESADDSLELLKFYRYNIAPWLDICDTDQHFGVTLLTEARRSHVLRSGIMQLVRGSSSIVSNPEDPTMKESTWSGISHGRAASDANEELVASVLKFLADMVPNLAASWLRVGELNSSRYLQESLLLELGSSSLDTCAYWLLVRLGKLRSPKDSVFLLC